MTTIIFERLILGFQATTWILILFWENISMAETWILRFKDYSVLITLFGLSFIYTIGIIFDNLCIGVEKIAFWVAKRIPPKSKAAELGHRNKLIKIIIHDSKIYELIEKKSLITKIVRATFVNIFIAFTVLVFKQRELLGSPSTWKQISYILAAMISILVFEMIYLINKKDEERLIESIHKTIMESEKR